MGKLLTKISLVLCNIKSAIQSLGWHKDSTVVLVGSWFGEKFADNSRFLFQYLSENKRNLGLTHVVWVTRSRDVLNKLNDMGYEVYLMDSEASIEYHKKAKYHIICNAASSVYNFSADILTDYSWRAKCVNLWHGVGVVKGVGCDSNEYLSKKNKHKFLYGVKEFFYIHSSLYRKFFTLRGGWGDCWYVAPSFDERHKMQKEFLRPSGNFIITGYARNCICPALSDQEQQVLDSIKKFNKTIIYMPTFKTGTNNFDFRTVGRSLAVFLKENNILWIQKGHSADKFSSEYSFKDNILNLPSDFDTNTIMPYIGVLVTDYSSAMMDAVFHQKPVLLYLPDYDEFLQGERGLIPEANEIMSGCGYMYKDINALKTGIIDTFRNPDSAKPKRYNDTRFKYWGQERTIEEIWKDIVRTTV